MAPYTPIDYAHYRARANLERAKVLREMMASIRAYFAAPAQSRDVAPTQAAQPCHS